MSPDSVLTIIFPAVAAAYFLMMIILTAGLFLGKQFIVPQQEFSVHVSVIIPARNEEENILNCLRDLNQQTYPMNLVEFIIIDDASTDMTRSIIEDFLNKHPGFPCLFIPVDQDAPLAGSKKRAIERAFIHSSGELIITTDADTSRGKNWVTSMASFYEKHRPKMILGPVAFTNTRSLFARLQSLEFMGLISVTDASANLGQPLMCNGANLAYSRDAFEKAGGFKDNFNTPSGDDMFLMMKIRKTFGPEAVKFNRSQEAIVHTPANKNFQSFFHQRVRWVSKSKKYKDPVVIIAAAVTYIFNAILFTGLICTFFDSSFGLLTVILLVVKMIIEFPMLFLYAGFLQKKQDLYLLPLVQLLNIFYVTIFGLLGNFLPYGWKGRSVGK